ncbi:LacI family DNA-binding transcriptional regulator [Cellulomonas marina]|uniref:DNA-binding transcriptional regulator, LacI/PurR family n=1 Tax=Cellulomonas marina TaxID=988821 RepID=A0A1I0X784_9CELL|nr:LacI family DNA-binding transcriptional regulator [Cellulomonas marina]GIG29488.1 hypothetical protein Cma02nite_20880 [Cellulomonas marina]SFA96899.1 DNA-binding transcriptional regulator, LacI/PurR family [Cellulomonas marina]
MTRPTLADVGAVAGVSAKSVSNVLLGRPGVSAATREAVLAAVEQVGYSVDLAGRGLASGRTGRVAVVVPNLYQPYFAELAERLIHALAAHDLTATLRVAHDGAAERDAVLGPGTRDVDGIILCPHALVGQPLADAAALRPLVQLGSSPTPGVDGVAMGEREGTLAMTRHLLNGGRRRIALVWNHAPGTTPSGDRYEGYVEGLAERGLAVDPDLVVAGSDWDRRASGYEAMTGLLRTGRSFDAALCVNDAIAVGVLGALRAHGLRVPQDVAVSGFDDTDEAGFTVPALTSVSPEQGSMVEAAVGMLVGRLAGDDGPARHVRTHAHLVVRASTAPRSGRPSRPAGAELPTGRTVRGKRVPPSAVRCLTTLNTRRRDRGRRPVKESALTDLMAAPVAAAPAVPLAAVARHRPLDLRSVRLDPRSPLGVWQRRNAEATIPHCIEQQERSQDERDHGEGGARGARGACGPRGTGAEQDGRRPRGPRSRRLRPVCRRGACRRPVCEEFLSRRTAGLRVLRPPPARRCDRRHGHPGEVGDRLCTRPYDGQPPGPRVQARRRGAGGRARSCSSSSRAVRRGPPYRTTPDDGGRARGVRWRSPAPSWS